jgi:hypothetical protein
MLERLVRWAIVGAGLMAPLVGACADEHTADDCMLTDRCPPPDAGDAGDAGKDADGTAP